ncbi:MAG: hypothetical protein WC314_16060 [Vulcanimicrobiota bacterium]
MAEPEYGIVDIHSLEPGEEGWELCVYQTPQILKVIDESLVQTLTEALHQGQPVELVWDPTQALVLGAS